MESSEKTEHNGVDITEKVDDLTDSDVALLKNEGYNFFWKDNAGKVFMAGNRAQVDRTLLKNTLFQGNTPNPPKDWRGSGENWTK